MNRRIHKLKTVGPFYQDVQDEMKPFEIRYDDRAYRVNDYLQLCEWDGKAFTGRHVWRRVIYVLSSGQFEGLAAGYVCMALQVPSYQTIRMLELTLAPCIPLETTGARP